MAYKSNDTTQQDAEPLDLDHSTAHLIRMAHRSFQQSLQAQLAVYEIKLSHWHCLRYLFEEEGLTQKELSNRVQVNESTIVAVIQEMEDIGLIKRTRNPLDRRKYALNLTAKARRLTKKLLPFAKEVNRQGTKNISEEEKRQYHMLTQTIIANLKESKTESNQAVENPTRG